MFWGKIEGSFAELKLFLRSNFGLLHYLRIEI